MSDREYLEGLLARQDLADDGAELTELRKHRRDVEKILVERFSECAPTIRYGGSKAKGTLIKEFYDLDLICYFPRDDSEAGETLKEIFDNVRDALNDQYDIEEKTSALRLRSKDPGTVGKDFHIDVVPGRYIDDSGSDCFLHQSRGDKDRLMTNLETHINHIKDSGVVDAIRLMKLWKVRRGLCVKQFVFELLIIRLLEAKGKASLASQLEHVWEQISDAQEPIAVEDPANPVGNDLMPALQDGIWSQLSSAATATLRTLENSGWEAIFGTVTKLSESARVARLQTAAAVVSRPTKPWAVDV